MDTKKCCLCGELQPLNDFRKRENVPDGLQYRCRSCERTYHKAWRDTHSDSVKTARSRNLQANGDKIRARRRAKNAANPEVSKQYRLNFARKFPGRPTELSKSWALAHPESRKETYRRSNAKRRADLSHRLHCNISRGIRATLRPGVKSGWAWETVLGYDAAQLKAHLENQFDELMTWENYGSYWEIDHIIPKAAFKFQGPYDEGFQKCWAMSNLQPLEAGENSRKKDRLPASFQPIV